VNNTKLVPFGKYKEQPIEVLLEDTNYTEWILSNDGIKENYSWVYNAIKSAMSNEDTPEHNKIQSRFLQQKYCKKIV